MFKVIQKILKIVMQIIIGIAILIAFYTAYIVFAPDDMPKPFRLVYDLTIPTQVPTPEIIIIPTPTQAPSVTHPGEGVMVNLSTKIINLLDPGGRKYIRLTIVVEFAPDNPDYHSLPEEEKTAFLTEFEQILNSRIPIMDDTVITLLSTKTFEDLYTAEGKELLRDEIMKTLSEKLPDQHIISIYFTEFVVQ